MFEIGFSEIILVTIVALLVFGPEKLPGLARDIGLWTGRIRRMISSVQQDVQRELSRADELKRLVEEQQNILDRHIIVDDLLPAVPVTGKPLAAPTETSPPSALPEQGGIAGAVVSAPIITPADPAPIPEPQALSPGTPADVQTKQAK